jgi:hypothetical protein
MAIEAAVPSTTEKIIVQNAMMRLFQAAHRNTIEHTTAQVLKGEGYPVTKTLRRSRWAIA